MREGEVGGRGSYALSLVAYGDHSGSLYMIKQAQLGFVERHSAEKAEIEIKPAPPPHQVSAS